MSILKELLAMNEAEEAASGFNFKLGQPLDEADIDEVLDAFINYAIEEGFNEQDDPDDGTDELIRQMEMWLDDGNYEDGEVEDFMEKYESQIYEHIYAGLT